MIQEKLASPPTLALTRSQGTNIAETDDCARKMRGFLSRSSLTGTRFQLGTGQDRYLAWTTRRILLTKIGFLLLGCVTSPPSP